MKKYFLILLFFAASTAYSQKVYDTAIDTNATTHIVFYQVQDSTLADIWVCVVDSVSKVYKEGQWYLVDNSLESLFNFAFTQDENLADMKVYYVMDPKSAGWRNTAKRYLYINARRRYQ